MDTQLSATRTKTGFLSLADCNLDTFRSQVEQTLDLADYPHALAAEKNVLIYDSAALLQQASVSAEAHRAILSEICRAFETGPGVAVFKNAMPDVQIIDRASALFSQIIDEQHRTKSGGGDHFAKPGANDRIWNSLEKHCLADPENFVRYYGNPVIALASLAWLGPHYQMTAQVNRVNPGGAAQSAHRDYHLGFQSPAAIDLFPAHVHRLSPVLTLQGAVAHCDMPLESGPTLFLPFSQMYEPGYLALSLPEFRDYFAAHHVQLPLAKGDMVFFNPALYHAAGTNRSADILRVANLLQVSSAFGRAMETVDRVAMCRALYPILLQMQAEGTVDAVTIANAIASSAEVYSFPTNLDRDPPVGGLAPKTQAQLLKEALAEGWPVAAFNGFLADHAAKRLS